MKVKKLFALLLAAVVALSATAFAAEYRYEDDIAFTYDENSFEITMEDHTDDEDLIILTATDEAWGNTYIRIHLADLDDGETFPTADEFTAMPGAGEVVQGEWNGYSDVFMYAVENEDGSSDNYFIAPVTDDDGEIEAILTIVIGINPIEDEETGIARDDMISEVMDTLWISD